MKKQKKSEKAENQQSVNQELNPKFPRFQVQFDLGYGGTYVEHEGESLTVPDMNLTVRQLLTNHSRGLSNDRHLKDPLYFDIRIPKIKDITDVYEYKNYLQQQQKDVEEFLAEEKKREEEKKENKQLRIDEEAENQLDTEQKEP